MRRVKRIVESVARSYCKTEQDAPFAAKWENIEKLSASSHLIAYQKWNLRSSKIKVVNSQILKVDKHKGDKLLQNPRSSRVV